MDLTHFKTMTRSLTEASSRRGVLTRLAGAAIAAAALRLATEAEAKRKGKKHKRKKKRNKPDARLDATCPGPHDTAFSVAGDKRIAQTFTAIASGPLVTAELSTLKLPGTNGDFILRLSPVDGASIPSNSVLAETTVANTSVPDWESTVSFKFANPYSVVAGTQYALVLTRPGSDQLLWTARDNSPCAGEAFLSLTQTATFTAHADFDLIFTTYIRP